MGNGQSGIGNSHWQLAIGNRLMGDREGSIADPIANWKSPNRRPILDWRLRSVDCRLQINSMRIADVRLEIGNRDCRLAIGLPLPDSTDYRLTINMGSC